MPSSRANGLALDEQGRLLAAEHQTRRLSRTEPGGVVTVVDVYEGDRFNSPNDIVVASDGTIYFTDPDYGLANPGDRELSFNGVYRVQGSTVTLEWPGVVGSNQPNGIALSPDESVVYVTDTQAGTLLAWDRAMDGSLSGQRTLAQGLPTPDGMCIDDLGNIYVATWGNGIEIFSPDAAHWGAIPMPRAASNCAFGGPARRTLYVTAHEGLYRVSVPMPGSPY
jgi:gluconolactonase